MMLDEDETALLRQARGAFDPGPEVTERVKAAVLASALGASLGGVTHATGAARRGVFSSWGLGQGLGGAGKILLGSMLVLGVSAGVAAFVFRNDAPALAPSPAETRVTTPTTPPREARRPMPAPSETPPVISGARNLAARAAPSTTLESLRRKTPRAASLASELAAVRAAEAAVNGGNPTEALSILEASSTSGPNLREEREAVRTLAECARTGAARAELATRFAKAFPASLYADRVRTACAE